MARHRSARSCPCDAGLSLVTLRPLDGAGEARRSDEADAVREPAPTTGSCNRRREVPGRARRQRSRHADSHRTPGHERQSREAGGSRDDAGGRHCRGDREPLPPRSGAGGVGHQARRSRRSCWMGSRSTMRWRSCRGPGHHARRPRGERSYRRRSADPAGRGDDQRQARASGSNSRSSARCSWCGRSCRTRKRTW